MDLKLRNHGYDDNITVLNTMYHYPARDENGHYGPDDITIVWKNLETGTKEHETIFNPKYTYFMANDNVNLDHNLFFIDKDLVHPVTVRYNNLDRDIAKQQGKLEDFYDNLRDANAKRNKMLHMNPRFFASDIDITAYYRMQFNLEYQNEVCPIDKSYFDIETDIKYIGGRFPSPGECPVNAVSFLIEKTDTEYTFLLKDKNNPKIEEFEKYIKENDFVKEFDDFLEDTVGGWKQLKRFHLDTLKHKIMFFDDEREMICSIFRLNNFIQPDFVLAWNMSFDIPFIIERLKILGLDPNIVMSHPDFEHKVARYWIDKRHINERAEATDYADISCYSVFLDQMIQFASRRKGQSKFNSIALDNIGQQIAGVKKLDYHHITESLADLPYIDYKTFVMYNMMDVIVQKCIEERTGDIDYVFAKTIQNSTQYDKVHRQTVYLANRARMNFLEQGFIMGNNCNKFGKEPDDKYIGALVADPNLVKDTLKEKLNYPGMPEVAIMVYKNADDWDYKRLYPSITQEFNIAPNTQVGLIRIPEKIYKDEDIFHSDKFNRSCVFIENFASHNYLEFCHRWLKLGNYQEVLDDIQEYFTKVEVPFEPLNRELVRSGKLEVLTKIGDRKINVVKRVPTNQKMKVINRYPIHNMASDQSIKNTIEQIAEDIRSH